LHCNAVELSADHVVVALLPALAVKHCIALLRLAPSGPV
jgi:hypothetical protein